MRRIRSDTVMPSRLASFSSTSRWGFVRVIDCLTVVAIRTTLAPQSIYATPIGGSLTGERQLTAERATYERLRAKFGGAS
jgi:hypothetical protein